MQNGGLAVDLGFRHRKPLHAAMQGGVEFGQQPTVPTTAVVRRFKAMRPVVTGAHVAYKSLIVGSTYEVGVWYRRPDAERKLRPAVKVYRSGFHACSVPLQCFFLGHYGYSMKTDVLLEVELAGDRDVAPDGELECADMFRIVRAVPRAEQEALVRVPCVVRLFSGATFWFVDGVLHRDHDLPAIEWGMGAGKEWWVHGVKHRAGDKPAVEKPGRREWWENGLLHRTTGPAIQDDVSLTYELYIHGLRQTPDPLDFLGM